MSVIMTNHAEQRIKDRLGISKKQADKIAEKALKEGITHEQTKGNLKKYLNKLYLSHKTANNMRVYKQKVFLFNNRTLITVINLPNNLIKIANSLNANKREV